MITRTDVTTRTPDRAAPASAAQSTPEILTIEDLIAYLRLDADCEKPRAAVRNLIRRHRLPVLRLGRKWRFRRSDVDAWLSRRDKRP